MAAMNELDFVHLVPIYLTQSSLILCFINEEKKRSFKYVTNNDN